METKSINGLQFLELMKGGAANLQANAKIVNDLNVFPIPDGDTGANMMQTVLGGIASACACAADAISAVSSAMADGMVLSARGNSGVILSQFFSGIAKGFQGIDVADVATIGFAFRSGVRRAYEAVMKPTEGTMLTVMREAADYACSRIHDGSTVEDFFADCLQEMNASLQRTPEYLEVLREAGVIDSGGAGLVYIVDGMNQVLNGENRLQMLSIGAPTAAVPDTSGFDENSVMEYGYCTEFLLQLQCCKGAVEAFSLEAFKQQLSDMGDSIVAFQVGTIVKVHIHTMHPGDVLSFSQHYGEFLTLKIENMMLQHNESIIRNDFPAPSAADEKPRSRFATVTIAAGSGVQQTLKGLGADVVIDGGQGSNPSTEQLIQAFDQANADCIFVLPNNGNILLTAHQAAELYDKSEVRVIESCDIGEGYAALTMLSYDSGDAEEIADTMREAMEGVVTGLVTRAVRDAHLDGVQIHTGDYIGFAGKNMLCADVDKVEAAMRLMDRLHAENHEVLIAIYGGGVKYDEKLRFREGAAAAYPRMELFEIDGGQDGYDMQLILE